MKNRFKAFNLIFLFRFYAVIDVLFAEKFELIAWNKDGSPKSKARFWRTEIKDAIKKGLL